MEEKVNEAKDDSNKGALKLLQLKTGSKADYEAEANWMVLQKDEKPKAEMFFIRYSVVDESSNDRPVTFVFNGGPGASSVYLHLGALGPRRVKLTNDGMPLSPPYKLTDNEETWLEFTDLVFIDPVGTGFSRIIDIDDKKDLGDKDSKAVDKPDDEYWKLKRDLESLSEFIRKYLSKYSRWESPVPDR